MWWLTCCIPIGGKIRRFPFKTGMHPQVYDGVVVQVGRRNCDSRIMLPEPAPYPLKHTCKYPSVFRDLPQRRRNVKPSLNCFTIRAPTGSGPSSALNLLVIRVSSSPCASSSSSPSSRLSPPVSPHLPRSPTAIYSHHQETGPRTKPALCPEAFLEQKFGLLKMETL